MIRSGRNRWLASQSASAGRSKVDQRLRRNNCRLPVRPLGVRQAKDQDPLEDVIPGRVTTERPHQSAGPLRGQPGYLQ